MSIFDKDHFRYAREQYKNHWLKKKDSDWREAAGQAGFPQDDEFSMMQGCQGSCNLDIWYNSQFIQNETTNHCRGDIRSKYLLERTPVLDNSLTCTVYVGAASVQVGYLKNGKINFDKIGDPEFFCEAGNVNLTTGEVTVRWNKLPPDNFLVVSYEYNLECQWSDQ